MLFNESYTPLVRFAEGILFDAQLSQDIVQDLFIHIWENAESIEITSSIKGYLFQSVRNRCLNKIKSLHIHDKNNLLYLEGILNSEDVNLIIESDESEKIQKTLTFLPDQMRKIFKMKYLENKKQKEIAKSLSISENTVKTHLTRAKAKLRSILYNT